VGLLVWWAMAQESSPVADPAGVATAGTTPEPQEIATEDPTQARIRAAAEAPAPRALINLKDRALFNPKCMKDVIDRQLKKKGIKLPKDLPGYTRLICDSLGKGHADAVRSFESMTGRSFKRILIVGGGSKNALLCQATANHAGVPVVSFALEGTATGNIANQLVALKAVKDLKAFRRQLNRKLKKKVYTPVAL
jgi:rhamnulokinase